MSEKIKKQVYERIGTLSIEEVLPHIEKNIPKRGKLKININGFVVNVSSIRLKTFAIHGTTCEYCRLKASYFAVERDVGTDKIHHLNLYGLNEHNEEIIFTHDHVLARALEGADDTSNTKTSCGPCNWNKGKLEKVIVESNDNKEKERLLHQMNQELSIK